MSVITLTDAKDELEIPAAETTFDARLRELIDDTIFGAEGEIQAKIEPVVNEVCYLDGGSNKLYLPHLNIGNVTVWSDYDQDWDASALVDSEDYVIDCPRGVIQFKDGIQFETGLQSVKVEYDGGYTGPSLPRDLKRAILVTIAYRWRRRKDPGLSAVVFPDGTVNKYMIDEWLPEVVKVFDRYRRMFL